MNICLEIIIRYISIGMAIWMAEIIFAFICGAFLSIYIEKHSLTHVGSFKDACRYVVSDSINEIKKWSAIKWTRIIFEYAILWPKVIYEDACFCYNILQAK